MNILELAKQTKELAEKATPGPWDGKWAAFGFPPYVRCPIVQVGVPIYGCPEEQDCLATTKRQGDQNFIAHSRTAAPQLANAVIEMAKFVHDNLERRLRYLKETDPDDEPDDYNWDEIVKAARALLTKLGIEVKP